MNIFKKNFPNCRILRLKAWLFFTEVAFFVSVCRIG